MVFKTMKDKVMLKLLPNELERIGSIHVPEDARKARRPYCAEVVATGPECREVAQGDMVYVGYFAGQWIRQADEDYLVVYEGEIPAILEDKGEGNIRHAYQ